MKKEKRQQPTRGKFCGSGTQDGPLSAVGWARKSKKRAEGLAGEVESEVSTVPLKAKEARPRHPQKQDSSRAK